MTKINFSWRQRALLCGLALYALFSSPTPDDPGLAEFAIILCLAVAIGIAPILRVLSGAVFFDRTMPFWTIAGTVALLYFLTVPFGIAVIDGASPRQIPRDLAPLLTAFLPLFFYPALSDPRWRKVFFCGILTIGAVFAVRYFFIIQKMPWQAGHKTLHDEFLYLPLSPEVLFSAIAFAVLGLLRFMRTSTSFWSDGIVAFVCMMVSALCFASLAGMLLRAALVLGSLAVFATGLTLAQRSWRRFFLIAAVGLCVLAMAPHPILRTIQSLQAQQDASGLNQRDAEFRAATEPLLRDPVDVWTGLGWGANVLSPAVGGLRVPYTHTFVSYIWVKSGLIGLALMLIYIVSLIAAVLRNRDHRHALILITVVPLALALTLYTSYKTLGFGLLLSYLAAHSKSIERKSA